MEDLSPELSLLKEHLNTLVSVSDMLHRVRNAPAVLLEPSMAQFDPLQHLGPDLFSSTSGIRSEFNKISDLYQYVRGNNVQDALKSLQSSELKDPDHLDVNSWRRDFRERQRAASPISGLPGADEIDEAEPIRLPHLKPGNSPLSSSDLNEYIRSYNRSRLNRKVAIHIWRAEDRLERPSDPVILRMILDDVLIAYITVGLSDDDDMGTMPLYAEFINIFGSRETKPPHSHSDYAVFQSMTQCLTEVLKNHPDAPLQSLVNLLESYHDIFLSRCRTCGRVASYEGHIPPVIRIWRPLENKTMANRTIAASDGVQEGEWLAQHIGCMET